MFKDKACCPFLNFRDIIHPSKKWSLRQIRGGSIKEVEEVRKVYRDAEERIASKEKELNLIIVAARQVAPAGAVVTFTEDFKEEAKTLHGRSIRWLIATAGFAVATIISAICYWPEVSPMVNKWDALRNLVSKAAVIAVFFTGTIWCSRIYRALIHQVAVNRH